MLKFIICDDDRKHNEHMKRRIEKIIASHNLDAKVVLCTDSLQEVLRYSQQNCEEKGNVYILDIDFKKETNGVEVARIIRNREASAYIIFVSAHQEYSLLCYKLKTFDFLLKPINYTILEECILSLVKDFNSLNQEKEKSVVVKTGSEVHKININDIYYCEKYGKILIIHTSKGIIQCYETLEHMQEMLEGYGFFRCHKSYLINLKHVSRISIKDNFVYLSNEEKCPVSRNYKKELLNHVARSS